jgi:LPS-assembly protein
LRPVRTGFRFALAFALAAALPLAAQEAGATAPASAKAPPGGAAPVAAPPGRAAPGTAAPSGLPPINPADAAPAGPAAGKAPVPADLTGDATSFDYASGDTIVRGHAELRDADLLLTADEIRFNARSAQASASGHVAITLKAERLLADRLVYHRKEGTFTAENLRAGNYPFYVEGRTAEGSRQEVLIHDAFVTYREPGGWEPTIRARTLVYSPGHYLRLGKAKAGVGPAQPLPVFRFRQDLSRPPGISYFSLDAGHRGEIGYYADVALNLPVANGVSLGPDVGVYTSRGVMAGPIANYDLVTQGDHEIEGSFRAGFIYDLGDRSTDVLGQAISADRAFAEWSHHETMGESLTFDANVNWWSDSDIVRDFRPKEFFKVQEPDNALEAAYAGNNYFFSVFTRFAPNPYFPTQQRLPEIRFDLLPTALGGGFYQRFNASVAYLKEIPPEAGTDLASDRFDAFYGLTRPWSYHGWLDVTPVAGARFTDYWATEGAARPGGTGRPLGEVGFDADFKSSATFDYHNPLWQIDGLRHLLTPVLSYRYIPDGDKAAAAIPPIDRSTFSTDLPILDLGDVRSIDQLQAVNVLRFGLDNTLETRDPVYGSRELLGFNLTDDLRFQRTPGQKRTSDVHADLVFKPARWLEVTVADSFASTSFAQKELNSNFTLRDADLASLTVGVGYLTDSYGVYTLPGLGTYPITGLDGYHVEGRFRINEVYDAFFRLDYDDRSHVFTNQYYGFHQRISNTWIVQYALTVSGGPSREHGIGFNVNVEIVRF